PTLTRLYDDLAIEHVAVDASQSFSRICDDGGTQRSCYLRFRVAHRPALDRRFLESTRMVALSGRLMTEGRRDLADGIDDEESFADYLARRDYPDSFVRRFLYPTLSSTVCTCSYSNLDRYPARIVLETLDRLTRQVSLRRIRHTANDVANRLTGSLTDIRLDCRVQSVVARDGGVDVAFDRAAEERFDHVVLATQANTAIRLLPEIRTTDLRVLQSIDYQTVQVVVHRDRQLMPCSRSDWSAFNMLSDAQSSAATCTVWMNRFHAEWTIDHDVFQSINPIIDPDPAKVIRRITLQRPIVTAESQKAVQRIHEMNRQPGRRIWFAGSWAAPGIPLLETGVVSARAVAAAICDAQPRLGLPVIEDTAIQDTAV
ncbi:MAG: hypothetical protein HKN47_05480, partial [Pirellulaceae bacterium]|nr:hypothetical protein [Pirellulaceae bacterium]